MAKLTRKLMKLFGSTAGTNAIAKFGSLAAGSATRYTGATADPDNIQALGNWLTGWYGAVLGGNSPAIEDMNGAMFVFAYQLAYLMQTGVPEWNSGTTYYIGSLVNNGSGVLYRSLTDTNLNNVLTDTTNWALSNGKLNVLNVSAVHAIVAAENGFCYDTDVSTVGFNFTLPSPAAVGSGFNFSIIDKNGSFNTTNFPTLVPFGPDKIMGLNSNFLMKSTWSQWNFYTDGTDWFQR